MDVVARARACVGTRFRPQGRSIGEGLDCVGVAAHAFGVAAPAGYAMRGGSADAIAARLVALGFVAAPDGALLLLAGGPHQFHLAVLTEAGFVHADATLRRVVEVPGWPRWPLLSRWGRG